MLSSRPFAELLDAFASSDPTPGGGSAAALMGAVGAALLAMVAGLPKTKSGAPEERAALDAARRDLLRFQTALRDLIDRDAAAYDRVVAAFRRPKATDAEKAERVAAIQEAMRVASEAPAETFRTCADALAAGTAVAAHANPSAASDVAVAVQALLAGMQGALLNVETNLASVKDGAFVDRLTAALRDAQARAGRAAAEIHRQPGVMKLGADAKGRVGD